MTSTTNTLMSSLAQFSKTASEVCAEVDKAARAATLEVQAWKQATSEAKAALAQAELTIAHQVENIESQHQTIDELRRELSQWKDQARNWQEHFVRVEQERCAEQSSRFLQIAGTSLKHRNENSSTRKEGRQPSIVVPNPNLNSSKRKKATNSIQQLDAARTTLIRRVQAVVEVKLEESDDDSYQEEDNEEEDNDDDELMMGAEENHEEIYGTQRSIETLDSQRSKQHPTKAAAPRKKRRKVVVR